jgi:hypothetical protein
MAKGFKTNKPTELLGHTEEVEKTAVSTTDTEPKMATTSSKTKTVAKRKVGRPTKDASGRLKKDYTEKVNIAIPTDVMERVRIASRCHSGTITDYINALIQKDLDANYKTYQKMIDTINNL